MKLCLVPLGVLAAVSILAAQTQQTFKARLSPVPIDAQLAPVITGHGMVSAVLTGSKLAVTGTFEGMHSPATAAHLHESKMTGVRGVMIHELTVSKSPAGNVSGSVELTPAEVEALRKGLLYVVVHSEGAPDGNLWGWLLK
ncbi:MAG TPA: CHRD domain-containing protein [Bryobacteraceae bacterium]|nr:CHRD domain-containing protein [Bryobacteraceae bacterium]